MTLRQELEEARAKVAEIERQIAAASCREAGHDWQFKGGRACCCDGDGDCSLPVHECAACGDCDYGDNPEADDIRAACRMVK